MSLLVVAAHPDDEVLGCGATIAKLSSRGQKIFIAIMGQGIASRSDHGTSPSETEGQIQLLHQQSQDAAALIGAENIFFYNLPDNRFDAIPLLDIIKPLEALIEKLKPDTIFTHHSGDLNIDHQRIHQAVLTAARPMEMCPVKEIYTFEIPSSTEWSFRQESTFIPNYFIDISRFIEIKVKAMAFYESEIRSFPHPRSARYIKNLARIRGATVGKNYCEAFTLIRKTD